MLRPLICALLLACFVYAPAATAGPLGEWDEKCTKIDEEWKAFQIANHKVYVTMRHSKQGLSDKDPKIAKKYAKPIQKWAKATLKFLEQTDKAYKKNWNYKEISQHLAGGIKDLKKYMPLFKKPYKKDGPRFPNEYNKLMQTVSSIHALTAREAILTAELCYYDLSLKEPHNKIDWREWNQTIKRELDQAGPGL